MRPAVLPEDALLVKAVATRAFPGPGYRLGAGAMGLLTHLLSQWEVTGREHVPGAGPLIVVANHFSFMDPPLLAASFPRPLAFLAKAELWKAIPSRAFCEAMGVLPVRRGEADRAALRRVLSVLGNGGAVGVFPEGTRGRSAPRGLKAGRPGAALLARLSGAPVIPVGITGTDVLDSPAAVVWQALRRPALTVRIGTPFMLRSGTVRGKEALAADTEQIMQAIAALLPPHHRGAYQPAATGARAAEGAAAANKVNLW